MDRERFEELKDAFVLGALPEEERREFEEYLAAYPERQAEIGELGTVAGLLALAPQEQEPSLALRRASWPRSILRRNVPTQSLVPGSRR